MIVVYSASSQHTANLSFVIFLSFFFFFFCMSPDRSRQVLISTLAGCQINAPVKTLGARISPFYEQSSVVLYFYFVLFRVLTCSGEWWGLRESRIAWVCTVHHVLSEICAGSLLDHISRTEEKKKKKVNRTKWYLRSRGIYYGLLRWSPFWKQVWWDKLGAPFATVIGLSGLQASRKCLGFLTPGIP